MKNNRGFTLIELLVVIAVIGILASVVLASLNSARGKARDARRLADGRQLELILQIYYDTYGTFPNLPGNMYWTSGPVGNSWAEFEAAIGQKLPTPPSSTEYYEYYKFWNIGTAGATTCYGKSILRIVPGFEKRPQVRECDEQYSGQGSTYLIE